VESAFDKAAAKGIVHPNKAARKKGRLAKAVQRSGTAAPKTAKGKSSRKK
jgi:ribosomal protein S20